MAPKKSTTATKAAPAAKTLTAAEKKAAADASKKAAEAVAAKREAREKQTAEQQAAVVKRVVNGDEKLAAVAKDLKITSGKAAFLIMLHRVAEGDVPSITAKTDEALLTAIAAARAKADEYSSWGWLAARSGKSEGFIKDGLAKAGKFEPRAENISSKRAAAKPKKAPAAKGATGTGKKKTVRGNA